MTSRKTWQVAGCLFMAVGMFGKFSAFLASIPDPVIGALLMIGLGMVISVGLSNLQFVDLSSGRNHIILGISILTGFSVSMYVQRTPYAISTGRRSVDQFFTVLLSNGVIVGGALTFILDNLLTGTQEERGFVKFNQECQKKDDDDVNKPTMNAYNLPSMTCPPRCSTSAENVIQVETSPIFRGPYHRFLTYLPFLPCYIDRSYSCADICGRGSSVNAKDIDDKVNSAPPAIRVSVV